MEGIKTLENFIAEKVKEVDVVAEVLTDGCKLGEVCSAEYHFDMVLMCKLCGKLC